jgi:DNA-binding response OmpR family regulator
MKLTKRLSILYAEDNEDAGIMLKILLEMSEIDVFIAISVEEALRAALNGDFDLYLLDNRFPGESGLELCQRLRTFSPRTPIVFYSSAAYASDRQKGLDAGADVYLVKPEVGTVASTIFQLVAENSTNAS